MAEDQKNTPKEFRSFFEGTPLEDMMRKMMEAKKAGHPFHCAEMMSQMMQMCCSAREKKERPTQEAKENLGPNQ